MSENSTQINPRSQVKVIWNGKLLITSSHKIKGLTPEMMVWWSTHRSTERIKMWHPDHVYFKVKYKPESGHAGSVYKIKEKHGKYTLYHTLTVHGVTQNSFTFTQNARGYLRNSHIEWEATPDGCIANSTSVIGSDNPVWGRFWNWVTRKFLFTDTYRAAAAKHSLTEGENLKAFLPKLFEENVNKEV